MREDCRPGVEKGGCGLGIEERCCSVRLAGPVDRLGDDTADTGAEGSSSEKPPVTRSSSSESSMSSENARGVCESSRAVDPLE